MGNIVISDEKQTPRIEKVAPFDASCQTTDSFKSYLHYHPNYYELYIFLGGSARLHLEGNLHNLSPGDTFLISPGTPHMVEKLNNSFPYSRIVGHLSPEFLSDISNGEKNFQSFLRNMLNKRYRLSAQEITLITSYIDVLQDEFKSSENPCRWMIIRSCYALIMSYVIRHTQNTPSRTDDYPEVIRTALAYIEQHLTDEELSIRSISDYLNVSGSYISHAFKSCFNESIWKNIIYRRLLTAQKLLLSGQSVTDTCFACGFTSYSNFIKAFSKMFGDTPHKYVTRHKDYKRKKTVKLPQ